MQRIERIVKLWVEEFGPPNWNNLEWFPLQRGNGPLWSIHTQELVKLGLLELRSEFQFTNINDPQTKSLRCVATWSGVEPYYETACSLMDGNLWPDAWPDDLGLLALHEREISVRTPLLLSTGSGQGIGDLLNGMDAAAATKVLLEHSSEPPIFEVDRPEIEFVEVDGRTVFGTYDSVFDSVDGGFLGTENTQTPDWDPQSRTLRFLTDDRKFAPQTGDAVLDILSAFQADQWASRVINPLRDPTKTPEALRTINKNLDCLKFSSDGNYLAWKSHETPNEVPVKS